MHEDRSVVLHVQDDVTPAAVSPVPRDRFATVGHFVNQLFNNQKSWEFTREFFGIFDISSSFHYSEIFLGSVCETFHRDELEFVLRDNYHSSGEEDTKADNDPISSALLSMKRVSFARGAQDKI